MKRTKKYIIVLVVGTLINALPVYAQTRGAANIKVKKTNGKTEEVKLYDASYALVIGNGSYTNGWDNLPGVKSDVAAIKGVLEKQGFTVETAENLSSRDFANRIQQFIDDYGYAANNRLLVYYAGHGHTLKSTGDGRDLGYVLPVDAPLPAKDEIGFKRKAIPMDDIQNFAKKIQAKHALFLFDSCFSGRLVTRNAIVVPPIIQESVAYPVRQFITAGAANQPVPDESIFRRSFVRALEGEADRNSDGYITGTELAEYLKEKVTNYSNRRQTPQYGKINDVELDRGDFVFVTTKIVDSYSEIEKEFWEAIKNSTDAEDFQLYKEKYPNGKYINLAYLKIKQLGINSNNTTKDKNTQLNKSQKPVSDINEYQLLPFVASNGKYGFKDSEGEIIIQPTFDITYYFSDGLALVKVGDKFGYIDKTGSVRIDIKFDEAQFFNNGKAKVKINYREFYIDKNGNEIR